MGKAIGSIGKHAMCAGTPNETAIMDRVDGIKSAWNASVKARKDKVRLSQYAGLCSCVIALLVCADTCALLLF